ncbi:hypothetical protein POL68_12180 [Stigmatella sp. ncwal1]|uniref:Uncharacterized protein n=1 Tax=Stigmatella ashevillensis TaxID=2995309 RepID=A0ABT5D6P3_9BACT|nr:hypothetical protein [Stigmatella ashevillena]MDC0709221.1 hypothetical protein [Stigmatella ashevillena]
MTTLLQTVLSWPLQQAAAWLDGLAIGEPVEGEYFNWELLAFTAAARAHEERSLLWARIALRVYGVLAERASARERHSFMLSAMNLRASMICEFGAREGDDVLDPESIVAWFQRFATMSIEEAARVSSEDLRTLPMEMLRKLRDIKNALNVVALLSETGVVQKHPELESWLQLRPRLP